MSIKIEVETDVFKKDRKYPWLGKRKDSGRMVYFTSCKSGICLDSKGFNDEIGFYKEDFFDESEYQQILGKIIITCD